MFLFSPIGNSFIANFLTKNLESKTGIAWEVRSFKLYPNSFSLDFSAQNENLELFAKGNYSLLTQNIQGDFLLNSKGSTLPLKTSQKPLNIAKDVWIEGLFAGKFANYFIQASSNILQARSDLSMAFSYLTLQSISLDMKDASLTETLEMLNVIPYSDGVLNLNLQLNRHLAQNTFDGNITLNVDGGDLDTEAFLKSFGLNIAPTHFITQLQGTISQNTLEYTLNLYSNIGDMLLAGTTNIQSLATNMDFNIKLQSLSPFSPFFKIPLNGSFLAKGTTRGDMKNMLIQGEITLENSPLDFRLSLQKFKPHTFELNSKSLQAMSLLKLLNQPTYLNGILTLKVLLRDFTHGISGIAQIQGENLFINSPLLETHTKIGFPSTAFRLDSKIELAQGKGVVDYLLYSNIANLQSQGGNITLNPFSLNLPQKISVSKLQNLSYRNKSLFNGELNLSGVATQNSIDLNGTITQEKIESKTSFALNPKRLSFYLSQLNSEQIRTILPKIPPSLNSLEGRANLHLQQDFIKQVEHINFDFLTLRFHNSTLLKNLNKISCKNLNKATFSGHIYNQLHTNGTLLSAITLQKIATHKKDSKSPLINASKIITNLNTQALSGNLTFKCDKITQETNLSGTIQNPKFAKAR
ncbi:hypothetical protein [Helicobacter turcicus]|uniref:AsmA-like C-terminal domain-containing protein n=1 Tax=Helicobacter turcicus TaxID=2867412 RepID=A0ABS7JMD8_9HELI|nr:hypothetical protein [Helicobacter turcicus]MBX7490561.1 hypothetical protein [Helicobacter turcicus]MBX7545529.1 hypothetical protein [Helicobacter turcicus]